MLPSSFLPHEKYFKSSCTSHTRFGFIFAEHLDSDKIAYATQASEMQLCIDIITASQQSITFKALRFFRSEIVPCLVDGHETEIEGFPVEFSIADFCQLSQYYPEMLDMAEDEYVVISTNVSVSFILKYSYFDRLHHSIDSLSHKVLQRIMPQKSHLFTTVAERDKRFKERVRCPKAECLHLVGPQMHALKAILMYDSDKAPILIFGSFGTGKTRILASAVYSILSKKKKNYTPKILLCAHHQSTIDTFVKSYFSALESLNVKMARIIPQETYWRATGFEKYYYPLSEFRDQPLSLFQFVVTTFSTALYFQQYLPQGHFTHILIDEGAQTREPETIAALSMATCNTKIVIVGDHKQVSYRIYHNVFMILCRLAHHCWC